MFVGHYGPSFVARALNKSIPLWVLFLAVQLVDVIWAILVILGIEKVRIVPGITATNPFDLYYMPYTHSLVAATLWAIGAAIVYRLFPRLGSWSAGGLVGLAVFSHWILDLAVHRPDLPLYDDTLKVGLGLWNYPAPAFILETAFLFGGMYLYLRARERISVGARNGAIVFALAMLVVQAFVFFGPPPSSDKAAAVTALSAYSAFTGIAYWLERKHA